MNAAGTRSVIDAAFYGSSRAVSMNCVSLVAYVPKRERMKKDWHQIPFIWKDHQAWEYRAVENHRKNELVNPKSLICNVFPGFQDKMTVPSTFSSMKTLVANFKGGVEMIVGEIRLSEKKIVSPVKKTCISKLIWRDSGGEYGPVLNNPYSWYSALPFLRFDDLVASSRWVPKTSNLVLKYDDKYQTSEGQMLYSGQKVFFHLRVLVTKFSPPLSLDDLSLTDKSHRPKEYWTVSQWESFF